MPDDSLRLAVLIDADNASAAVIGDILSEVASLGTASVKRVYGDFTTSNLHSWRTVLLEHAIWLTAGAFAGALGPTGTRRRGQVFDLDRRRAASSGHLPRAARR